MRVLDDMVLVETDLDQKQSVSVNGHPFFIVPNRGGYNENGRQTNPVIAKVILAGKRTPFIKGDILVTSHNSLVNKSMQLGQYNVIPYDRWILATVTNKGELKPTKEHVIGERVLKPTSVDGFELPETAQKFYEDRILTADGDILGIKKWADYEVVYNWKGEECKRIVVWKNDIICKL